MRGLGKGEQRFKLLAAAAGTSNYNLPHGRGRSTMPLLQ